MIADGFPVLNALRDVHLILSQGAHNQFGDLPSTARIEMLMQQWLLARPEFREFLPTRIMVAYPEQWMDRVDAMKKMQGWTDTSVLNFRNLGTFGEQVLLSIRYGNWNDVVEPLQATNWARFSGGPKFKATCTLIGRSPASTSRPQMSAEQSTRHCRQSCFASDWQSRLPAEARPMLDFTSALYLGLRHPSASLAPWDALTLGRPAALVEPPDADAVAGELARLQGSEAATLVPSTLHLFWDLFRVLDRKQAAILCDAGLYPMARWGAERAAGLGTPVRTFPHHDVAALARLISCMARAKLRPIVVRTATARTAGGQRRSGPMPNLRAALTAISSSTTRRHWASSASRRAAPTPMARGAAGRCAGTKRSGRTSSSASSLAKGFGVPLAALSGSRALIDRFREHSETRVHCSPPSVAAIHAAQRALRVNRRHGETLRRRLLGLVVRLRQRLVAAGLTPVGGLPFPVQSFRADHFSPIARLFQWLWRGGVRALLTRGCTAIAESLTFLVTARHERADIDYVSELAASAAHVGAGDAGLVAARQILRAERDAAE